MECDSRGRPELVRHSGHVDAMFEAWRSRSQRAYVRTVTCAHEWISVWISSFRRHRSPLESESKGLFGSSFLEVRMCSESSFSQRAMVSCCWYVSFMSRNGSLSLICGAFLFSEPPRQLGIRRCLLMFFTARMLQRNC